MKIIAAANQQIFIVECSRAEVKIIASGDEYGSYCPCVGEEIDVHGIFRRVDKLSKLQGQLVDARKALRGIADALEPLDGIVSAPADAGPAKEGAA